MKTTLIFFSSPKSQSLSLQFGFLTFFFYSRSLSFTPLMAITLRSSDGETFVVDKEVALQSQVIKYVIEDTGADNEIPLPNVTGGILDKVIQFCALRAWDPNPSAWDTYFIQVDQAVLFDLILAANYLYINSLLDFTCQTVADMMKGKTAEEIRKTFNIKNDFTPEEEEEAQWAFE